MAKCSFGKVSLRGAFQEKWPYGTELYARLFYVGTDETEVLIAGLDTLDTWAEDAARFRKMVAEATHIPADNIWYHELQIHAAPESPALTGEYMSRIAARVSDEVKVMKANAVPFTCQVAECYLGTDYTYNREQYVAGLGGVTVWAGLKYDEKGRPYSQDPGRMLLRGYEPDLPVFEQPIYFDNTNDPLAYLFVFHDENGKVIGSISRFAAHPDVSVLFESHGVADYYYDYDWPGYLSDKMERAFGAPGMYLNGPCADLAVKKGFDGYVTYEKSTAESKRIGETIADVLLARYEEKRVPFGDADNCMAARFVIEVPMREDFPNHVMSREEVRAVTEEAAQALQEAIRRNAPAYEVKQLVDDRYRAEWLGMFFENYCKFDEETVARGTVKLDVTALRLGDYFFVGVPGECLVDMTQWLRSTYTGVKTIPVDQVNGYYGYMATPRSLTLGGYTYWCSWVSRHSIPILKEEIVKALEGFLTD